MNCDFLNALWNGIMEYALQGINNFKDTYWVKTKVTFSPTHTHTHKKKILYMHICLFVLYSPQFGPKIQSLHSKIEFVVEQI